jgi:hypothetical protein
MTHALGSVRLRPSWSTKGAEVVGKLSSSTAGRQRVPAVAWVVCGMITRDVRDGTVPCPLGGFAPLSRCRECHLLQALESDWHLIECQTPEE